MSRPFDPYDHWLGIPPQEQPPDHYRLLGLPRFEGDARRIQAAAEERMAMIRRYQTGPRAALTQPLLNELAAAKLRLLNPATKRQYDAALAEEPSLPVATFSAEHLPPPLVHEAAALPAHPPVPVTAASSPLAAAPTSAQWQVRVHADRRRRDFDPLLLGWWIPLAAAISVLTIGLVVWLVRGADVWSAHGDSQGRSAAKDQRPRTDDVEPAPSLVLIMQEGNGDVNLSTTVATLVGGVQLQAGEQDSVLGGWSTDEAAVQWTMKVVKLPPQGMFMAHVTYEADTAATGARYELDAGGPSRPREVRAGQGMVSEQFYLAVPGTGERRLTFRLKGKAPSASFLLRSVRLVFP